MSRFKLALGTRPKTPAMITLTRNTKKHQRRTNARAEIKQALLKFECQFKYCQPWVAIKTITQIAAHTCPHATLLQYFPYHDYAFTAHDICTLMIRKRLYHAADDFETLYGRLLLNYDPSVEKRDIKAVAEITNAVIAQALWNMSDPRNRAYVQDDHKREQIQLALECARLVCTLD